MPIRPELRRFYPPNWRILSAAIRFDRAGGRCERCGRPHKAILRCLPDGRWLDERSGFWRDGRNRRARRPDLLDLPGLRTTKPILATAHLNHDPTDNRRRNLLAVCQRCHLIHDRRYHQEQRRRTLRRRWAVGDLFLGPYG